MPTLTKEAPLPDERTKVELPLVEQLKGMGWRHLEGDIDVPYLTERQSFREVLLKDRLMAALRRINRDEQSQEWLDERRLNLALGALERLQAHKLMEANQQATELLLRGTVVDGDPERHGGRAQPVRFIDFDNPENNDLLVINQFRVDSSGGRTFIVPDIVLFVNGIPLAVIECKSPAATNPMQEAITQLLRYSNQRKEQGMVEEDEGAERLFHYNLLLVATFLNEARFATVGASFEHYLEWKDTSPVPSAEVAAQLGVDRLNSQQLLVAGMLRPAHLLDLLRNFTVFQQSAGKTVKMVARYPQFRAVYAAVRRLLHGKTRHEHGEFDMRGGIIWHTQGSGKSFTMVFLVRKMRTIPALRAFKVVVVTDRRDLEDQLSGTAALSGEDVTRATTTGSLQTLLRQEGPGLVFATIQKYQDREDNQPDEEAVEIFPELNPSERILVLVDEAHRSHASMLHANLLRGLPNCAHIGFTGTPIIMGAKKKTHEIFGEFIDRYTLRESQTDGATLPILYEGRTARAEVADGRSLDEVFEDFFRDRTPEELETIKAKYATKGNVLEAPNLIAAKTRDMLRHYVDHILPNGFKAQVVATSRLAAIRYRAAFVEAHQELVRALEALDPALLRLSAEQREQLNQETCFLVRAHALLPVIRRLEFAAVISGATNDDPSYREWTDPATIRTRIDRFKKPLVDRDPAKQDGLAFLCVKSMLLTGFDAPIEQVLYLDRGIREHELLQAIARVNRTRLGKNFGLVVDYYGVGHHLPEALAAYSQEDIQGAMLSIKDELPKLADRHARAVAFFRDRGIADLNDDQACVLLLRNVALRAEFMRLLKQFLDSLDLVLPRPEGLPYVRDGKLLGFIQKSAANLYRDPQLNLIGAGFKVRKLIDEHIEARGIDPRVPPISITDADFDRAVNARTGDRTKALEMEHAARHHIDRHFSEDPAYYQTLSERLEEILREFADNWAELVEALRKFTQEVRQGRQADATGLNPRTQAPFLALMMDAARKNAPVDQQGLERFAELAVNLVDHIRQEIGMVDFWRNLHHQNVLRAWIVTMLDENDVVPYEQIEPLADRIIELAKALHTRLTE
jgi:type I restriction enzyme R subunit